MGEIQQAVTAVFDDYDVDMTGELDSDQLQMIHCDMRVGGISLAQIEECVKYVCIGDKCVKSELYDVLQEMDRRYFLLQNLRWEFNMMDYQQANSITEEQSKWFVQLAHGQWFSELQWERFLRSRPVPGSAVSFNEIEVRLCNIPSREQFLADKEEERKDLLEKEKQRKEIQRLIDEEKEKRKRQRDEERKKQEKEDKIKQKEQDRRRREELMERQQRQDEKEDAEIRRKKMEDEEERGIRESEEREKKEKEKKRTKEMDKLKHEEDDLRKLREMEELRRLHEVGEALECEDILDDAVAKEKEAESEATRHNKRGLEATDDRTKKDATEAEKRARLRQREYRNKKIRYNLKVAIKRKDRVRLPPAVDDFKRAQLPDDDMDLDKAERLLKEFQARDGLKKAMTTRQLAELERAINFIKRNGFELQLERELIEAHKLLIQLRRLERIRAEILELKQSTVAEIRSYQKPPAMVHIVMTGTFLLLGNKEKDTKEWKTVQALVGKTGKEGLKRRCLECDPGAMNRNAANRARDLLEQFELDDVRDVSAGAATFYVWSWTMIEELEMRIQAAKYEEEEREREKEEQKQREEEEKRVREERKNKAEAGASPP